jgi:hypothetical protein
MCHWCVSVSVRERRAAGVFARSKGGAGVVSMREASAVSFNA